ncbi:MAG: AAA family ATPase [Rhodocyclaceae bacterium]|nr:AAA family ATPase [Rhodocyclaceae bacterium]
MYLQHFGLAEPPFSLTPDTSFVYSGQAHQEALNTLLVAVDSGEGFIKITGEVGTGKTLLCRRFLATVGADTVTAYLPNPALEPNTLLRALAEELAVEVGAEADQFHLMKAINSSLLGHAAAERRVVLCIDEAQTMPLETLEALRLISNLETEKRKLVQIVLFGQPELDAKLADPSARQLRQRITFHYRLGGLKRDEVAQYLAHRLRVAGYRGHPLFSGPSLRVLHRSSRGTPRVINILAHKALLAAFGEGQAQVRWRHIRLAARDSRELLPGRRWFF